MITIEQTIPNKAFPFEDVERKIRITDISINFQREGNPIAGLPQFVVTYEIVHTKNGINVSKEMTGKVEPKVFNNNTLLYKRSFDPDTLFEPIENPDFVEGESPEEQRYLTVGAFDFIIGDLVTNNGQYLIPFLKMYILDNYADGWFESGNIE